MKINNQNTTCQTACMRTRRLTEILAVAESAGVSIDGLPAQR